MGNACGCCGAREKGPEKGPAGPLALPEDASGGAEDYGFALAKNDRQKMEDAVAVNEDVAGYRLFAVFDGHGGDEATKLAQQLLPEQLHQHLQQAGCKKQAGSDAFTSVDDRLCAILREKLSQARSRRGVKEKMPISDTSSGTVECAALLKDKEILVINAGDCRLVASEGGTADQKRRKTRRSTWRNWGSVWMAAAWMGTVDIASVHPGPPIRASQEHLATSASNHAGKTVPDMICAPDVGVVSIEGLSQPIALGLHPICRLWPTGRILRIRPETSSFWRPTGCGMQVAAIVCNNRLQGFKANSVSESCCESSA